MSSSSHPSVDIKFDFVPFNGTPGETYDKWERALLNAGARADERGYSISDHLTGVDEGTTANPHLSGPRTADGRKSRQAQRKRQKDAYAILTRHLHAPEHLRHMELNHFQDGLAALLYICGDCAPRVALRPTNSDSVS